MKKEEQKVEIEKSLKIEFINKNKNIIHIQRNTTGFQSSLDNKQIKVLYDKMQNNYFNTTLANFKAIFKNEILPSGIEINWIE